MKILIVNNMAPFIWGGAEELAFHLQKNLILAGHEAEILRIPFTHEPAVKIPSQMLMASSLKIINVDRVIALKFPAYLVHHPFKTLWLLHQYRQAYDLFEVGESNLCGSHNDSIRQLIKNASDISFSLVNKIFVNSQVTKKRLIKYTGFESNVLMPPLNDPELFIGGQSKNYIFAGGRVNRMKRQYLLVEAMALTSKCVNLVIAGPPDEVKDIAQLHSLIETHNLQDRVKLDLRFLSRNQIADYVNHATACAYLPFDEDSLGYVTMEAACAGKPLITTSDSGGVLSLVHHRKTGWVVKPEAISLANALNQACGNVKLAKKMGIAAKKLLQKMQLNWPTTIKKLLS